MLNILTTKKVRPDKTFEDEDYVNYFDCGDDIMGI